MQNASSAGRKLTNEERVEVVKRQKKRNSFQLAMLSVIGILGFLLLWQAAVLAGVLPSRYVPAPTEVIALFATKLVDPNPDGAVLGVHIMASLQVALTGFLLAIVIGIPLGLFMGWFRGFDKFMRPIFEILRPIPPVSWIPLTIIWMGIGLQAKAFIVFFSAFVPCVINAYTGIKQSSPVLINVAKTCGATNFTVFRKIGIPSAMTMTFAGIRVALGNAWATLVAAEMLAANAGLGPTVCPGRHHYPGYCCHRRDRRHFHLGPGTAGEESAEVETMKQSSTSVIVMSDAERRERLRNRIYAVFPVISVLLLILLWFLAAGAENSTFPSPVDIWNRFLLLMEKPIKQLNLFGHIWASLLRVFIALAFAWLLGISFGILIGWNKKANALLGPLFTAFRSVPPLAWVPLMTMWFGTGEFPKILIVFIGALMPVVVNTQAGISNVQNMYLNVGTIFHANKRQMLFEIAIPSALDAIFAGVRTSTSAGWMVVLAAEMLGGKSGIGFLITRGMDSGDYALCLLSMVCIGLVGALLAIITQLLERMVCPWTAKKSN